MCPKKSLKKPVIPAQAGIQGVKSRGNACTGWMPAFAGMTPKVLLQNLPNRFRISGFGLMRGAVCNGAPRHAQHGFSLVTAIFILVILAALGAAMVTFSSAQHGTVAMDMQSARAYQAARAGIEWGAYEALKVPGFNCTGTPFTLTFPAGTNLTGFTTTVACSMTNHAEGANAVALFVLTSTATYGVVNTPDYVSRQVSARIARCMPPGGGTC